MFKSKYLGVAESKQIVKTNIFLHEKNLNYHFCMKNIKKIIFAQKTSKWIFLHDDIKSRHPGDGMNRNIHIWDIVKTVVLQRGRIDHFLQEMWEDVYLPWRPIKARFKYFKNAALLSLLADFTTNLYIQIVYTIRKFCTLLKKIVHFTIFFEQE